MQRNEKVWLGQLPKDTITSVEGSYSKAIDILETLASENPTVKNVRSLLGQSYAMLGDLQSNADNRPIQARLSLQKAIAILEQVADDNAADKAALSQLADAFRNLSQLQDRSGRYEEAETVLKHALQIDEGLVRESLSSLSDVPRGA